MVIGLLSLRQFDDMAGKEGMVYCSSLVFGSHIMEHPRSSLGADGKWHPSSIKFVFVSSVFTQNR